MHQKQVCIKYQQMHVLLTELTIRRNIKWSLTQSAVRYTADTDAVSQPCFNAAYFIFIQKVKIMALG